MSLKNRLVEFKRRLQVYNKPKIFGIGANKTGTTSLKAAMDDLGFIVGDQRKGELLLEDWAHRDFSNIIKLCRQGQFFQDVPFSLPNTYVILDNTFPNSKFILTVRDSAEQWYNSITKFHGKKWGKDGQIPTKEDLVNADYIFKGRAWRANRLIFDTPENQPYQKDRLLSFYNNYNDNVKYYFRTRPDDLLVLNVGEKGAYKKLCDFLKVESKRKEFPWKNKTINK
ncbi:sulfotransferase [Christiangramia sp. SM2212]|uniref:Sulfotransferase n=1 Tax=Christiangramia sediminicola TaxID=3073267 RepID=A0ABU1EQB3_9FLAO|nr:sulfotransferase [Christiangramia sp. SM2212]MDR5590581.1 sulfotransferase [Christiangramia sp. SM2212]